MPSLASRYQELETGGMSNVTVDDADQTGIITYFTSNFSGWADQTCPTCVAKPPDLSQVYNKTWHDTTHMINDTPLKAQFLFSGAIISQASAVVTLNPICAGSAIYLFGIQTNSTNGIPVKNNDLVFLLDGKPAGAYIHMPNDPNYAYHVNFFAQGNLVQGPHNLTMFVNGTSMALFDYLIYTTK
jgi:hypothetical protein